MRVAIRESAGNVRRHVNQATAAYLIACGVYRWALNATGSEIERVPFPEAMRQKPVLITTSGPYIPETLPPIEVPGCRFVNPAEPRFSGMLRAEPDRLTELLLAGLRSGL